MESRKSRIPLTVGQISDSLPPIVDGVAYTALNYARCIKGSYTIGPRCPGMPEPGEHDLRCRSVPLPGAAPYRYMIPRFDRRFRRELEKIDFDLLHAHSPFVSGKIAVQTARRRQIPAVATFHSKYREDLLRFLPSRRIADLIIPRIVSFYRQVDQVWVPSRATGTTLEAYGYTGPWEVVPNGVDFRPPEPAERKNLEMAGRKLADVDESSRVLLFAGQHAWKKNTRLIIEAFARVCSQQEDVVLAFAGEGPDAKGMRELAATLGISGRVRFLGRIDDRDELRSLYTLSYLFIFPSSYDNDPLVVKEAAACSTPSVLLAGSHAAEGVTDGENGFLIRQDARELAACIISLLHNRQLVERVGERAFSSRWRSWESITAEVSDRYQELIETRKH